MTKKIFDMGANLKPVEYIPFIGIDLSNDVRDFVSTFICSFDTSHLMTPTNHECDAMGVSILKTAYQSWSLDQYLVRYYEKILEHDLKRLEQRFFDIFIKDILEEYASRLKTREFHAKLTSWHGKRAGWLMADTLFVGRN
jgi:hypothetical protein